jgi:hypothetical protein
MANTRLDYDSRDYPGMPDEPRLKIDHDKTHVYLEVSDARMDDYSAMVLELTPGQARDLAEDLENALWHAAVSVELGD